MGIGFFLAYGMLFLFGGLFSAFFISIFIVGHKFYLLEEYSKKYPPIYKNLPKTSLVRKTLWNVGKISWNLENSPSIKRNLKEIDISNMWLSMYFKQILTFGIFSKKRYGYAFDQLINFEEVKKTKDKELISLVKKCRDLSRIPLLFFTILSLIILFSMIFLPIILNVLLNQ